MTEAVRIWRQDRVLLLAGATTHYAIEPRGEYVFGIVARRPMRSRRGRERRLVRPGQLVARDPSGAHSGAAVDGPWRSRLMIVEAGDDEFDPLAHVAFPDPVIDDPVLAAAFTHIHASLRQRASRPISSSRAPSVPWRSIATRSEPSRSAGSRSRTGG